MARQPRQGYRKRRRSFTYRILPSGIIQVKVKGCWQDHYGVISEAWEDAIRHHLRGSYEQA